MMWVREWDEERVGGQVGFRWSQVQPWLEEDRRGQRPSQDWSEPPEG